MRDSSQLRLSDLRHVFRLLHEVREISTRDPNPVAWRHHMIDRLCQLLHASQAVSPHWRNYTPTGDIQLEELVDVGWNSPKARAFWQQQVRERGFRADPLTDRISRIRAHVGAYGRRDLIGDLEWHRSDVLRGIAEICELDDALLSFFRHRDADQMSGIALNRFRGDGPFSAREYGILRLFNLELYRLYRQGQLCVTGEPHPSSATPLPSFSPRTQQILQALLRGHSLKQIAQQLELSRHTVNDHVKTIHRRLGVSTRAELLARCLGTGRQ